MRVWCTQHVLACQSVGFNNAFGKISVLAHRLYELYPEYVSDAVNGFHFFYHIEKLGVVSKDYLHHQVSRVLAEDSVDRLDAIR